MKKRMGESGNIFFTLFGAVALVGVVGAATSTLMRGPVGTVVALNQRAKADSQMQIAMKLAMLEAQNTSNDCDPNVPLGDGFIEPVGFAAGAVPGNLAGGGRLPSVGSTSNDPWGSPYGYCAWDHGAITGSGCSGGGPLLTGSPTGQGTVIAVLSAGPDRLFGLTCVNAPAPNAPYITRGTNGADDLIVSMTYAEANEASGGLWSIKSGEPDRITTNRELDVSTGAQFSSSNVNFSNPVTSFASGSKLDLTAGSLFMLPTEEQMTGCSGALDKGLLRRYTNAPTNNLEVLQICDGSAWLDIGGAGAVVSAAGNDYEVQFNLGGNMSADPGLRFTSGGLQVSGEGNFGGAVGVGSSLSVSNTLNVTGNTTLTGSLDVDSAADFDSTIDVAMGATFGSWLRGSDGTATAPTYSFTSDTDSGMFFSSNALRFSVDGSERMAVSAGGVTMTAGHALGNFTVDGTLTTNDLNVNNNITANRFISRMATTSAAQPGFETEPGTGMYSAVDNTLSLVTGGTPRLVIDGTGDVGIGVLAPNAKLDVGGEIKVGTSSLGCGPTLHGAIRYVSGDLLQVCSSVTGVWEDIGTSGGGGGGAASYWTRISSVDRRLYYDDAFVGVGTNNPQDDFHVAGDLLVTGGYTGTPSIGVSGAGTRMFFDPDSAAFRGGMVTANQWDAGNIGTGSFGWGSNAQASGNNTFVIGAEVSTTPAGAGGAALGNKVVADALRATAWGLGDATGAFPRVSGAESFGIFMGDQSGVNLAQGATMALLGGRFLIDQTPPPNPAVSGTLSLDVEGGVGAVQYCDENGVNCFTAASVATGGMTAPGNNRELIYNSGGVLGANPNMVFSSAGNLTLGGTGAIALPVGDDTNRPGASANGMLRYNTAQGRFEGYQGGEWRDLITGAALPAGFDSQIQFNSNGTFGAVSGFTFVQGEVRVDGTDYGRGGVIRIRGAETPATNYLDATMILESMASGNIWSQTLVSNIPSRNGDLVFAHYDGTVWREPLVLDNEGRVGIFSTNPRASLDINTTDAILLPVGSVDNRPTVPVDGMLRYNSQSGKFEGHQGGSWQDILTGSLSGGAAAPNRGIQFNSNGSFAANGNFVYTSAGSFLTEGTYSGAGDPDLPAGGGTRMFFDPTKGAFRAGRAPGDQWSYTSVGAYSAAMGYNNVALGQGSFAAGSSNNAIGNNSVALGFGARANGANSVALGNGAQATGDDSVAMGLSSRALGDRSVAIGGGQTSGHVADMGNIAIGLNASAAGTYTAAIGRETTSLGAYNIALGYRSRASGNSNIALGRGVHAWGGNSGAIGFGSATGLIPSVAAYQAFGIFMGDQSGVEMANGPSDNTMGIFGGKLVIDPRIPALQTVARATVDFGAATDAIVLPAGTTAERNAPALPAAVNGMLRYNTQSNKFEGYQNGAWQDILTSGVSGGAAAPNRGIQFNSGGSFAANNNLLYTSAGAFLISGTYTGAGTEPVSGAGTRMFFDPGKAAFRAGMVTGGEWNFTSVGNYSTAMGNNSIASGNSSTAIGLMVTASGAGSTAIGMGGTAGNSFATAIGRTVLASGDTSTALGFSTVASGDYSTALGREAVASGNSSVAIGWGSTASGDTSTALGRNTVASGSYSTAMGGNVTTASGAYSTAMGAATEARGGGSTTMGYGTIASGENSVAMGNHVTAGDGIAGSGLGNGSMALGLIEDTVLISTRSQVRGNQSLGIFMGDQDGLLMDVGNTMGLFGGQLVIDPRVPATQMVARGVIDVGAATNAIVLPIGSSTNRPAGVDGMIRYNSQSGKFEGHQGGSWQDIVTGAATSTFLSLTDTPASYTGQENKFVRVNAGSTALEFTDQIVPSMPGQPAPAATILNDLGDVTIATPSAGQILTYSSGQWVNGVAPTTTPAGLTSQLQFNSNGAFGATPSLTWDAGNAALNVIGRINISNRINIAGQSGNEPIGLSLSDLSGVAITTPSAGQILTYSGGQWINGAAPTATPAGTNTQIQFNNSGDFGASGNLTWNGTTFAVVGNVTYTGTLTDVSDMRLKDDILPLRDRGSMLDKLGQIGTYSFTMKDDKQSPVEFGVMAQEINKVFPELVVVDDSTAEKYMSVNYVGLIAPLIEASKELKSENESLKAQISTIEERMASLEGDMNGMKAHTGYGISKAQMGLGVMLGMILMGGMAGITMIAIQRRRGMPRK